MYFTENYITYLIETKEEVSSNIFLITVNENLYFKIKKPVFQITFPTSSSEGYTVSMPED